MLGYISIDKDKLSPNEKGLFQTFMCGICISTKELYGEVQRNLITNDINVLAMLLHSYLQITPEMYEARCISSPLKKRTIFRRSELFDNLATANVLLCYANLADDVVDGNSPAKKMALKALAKSYEKAKRRLPELDAEICAQYANLRALEKENSSSLDQVCECSALMLSAVVQNLIQNPSTILLNLCYNMGKWVYLADAVDDVSKDYRKGNYNPLISYFGDYANREDFLTAHQKEFEFIFYSVLNQIATDYNDLNLQQYRCVLDNVIYHAIRNKTEQLLTQKEKK